jgi:type IV pilus assembly protein PilM
MTGEENIQIGWQIIEKKNDRLDLLYTASPAIIVTEYLDVFRKAGIRIEAIEPQIISFLKGFLTLRSDLTKDAWFILIDVGFSKSTVVFFENGKLVYSRHFGWGIRRIWDYLRDKFKLLPAEIQEILNRSTQDNNLPYQLEEALNDTSDPLLSELRRSLTFFQSEYGKIVLDNCFLAGGGSNIIPLKTMLTVNLNVTFQDIKPIDTGHKKVASSGIYLSAMGASLWN